MWTQSKYGIVKPRCFPTLLLTVAEPRIVKQTLISTHWRQAMQAEYDALMTNYTWSLTTFPPERSTIDCKWVFRVKENSDGTINKYKARLMAKGFHKKIWVWLFRDFSLVVKLVTIQLVLTLALTINWSIEQIDINNAFLNGILHEDVYMAHPPSFESANFTLVCKLHRSLYGLKQAL